VADQFFKLFNKLPLLIAFKNRLALDASLLKLFVRTNAFKLTICFSFTLDQRLKFQLLFGETLLETEYLFLSIKAGGSFYINGSKLRLSNIFKILFEWSIFLNELPLFLAGEQKARFDLRLEFSLALSSLLLSDF